MINNSWFFGIGGGIIAGLVVTAIMSITFNVRCAKNKLNKFKNNPVNQLAKSRPWAFFVLMSAIPFFVMSLLREEPVLRENVIAPNPIGSCIINYTFPFLYALVVTLWVRHQLSKIETNEANQSSEPT